MRFTRREINLLIRAVGAELAAGHLDEDRVALIEIQVKLEKMLQGASNHIRPTEDPIPQKASACCEGARRLEKADGNLEGYWCAVHGLTERTP